MAEECHHDRIFPKACLPSWRWPVLSPQMGARLALEAHGRPACPRGRSPRGQPSPAEDAALGWWLLRELSPALWGWGTGTISSARESHGMPVPDFQAPAGLLGVYFLGGLTSVFSRPPGKFSLGFPSLTVSGESLEISECPSWPCRASVFLPSKCLVVAGPGGWGLRAGRHLPCAPVWVLRGAGHGPGYESRAACYPREGGTVGRKWVAPPVCLLPLLRPERSELS